MTENSKMCIQCGQTTVVDCETCSEWTCKKCGKVNTIQVEPAATKGGWLDENGICHFPSGVERLPVSVYIGSPETDILELVTGLVYNKPGPGFAVYAWDKAQKEPIPEEVKSRIIGIQMDKETIDMMRGEDPRAILLGDSGTNIQENGMTPEEWMAKYGTNGIAAIAKQRLFWYLNNGGVVVGKTKEGEQINEKKNVIKIGGKAGMKVSGKKEPLQLGKVR